MIPAASACLDVSNNLPINSIEINTKSDMAAWVSLDCVYLILVRDTMTHIKDCSAHTWQG